MLGKLLGSPWVLVASFLAGLAIGAASGGWAVYQRWDVDSLERDLAAAKAEGEALERQRDAARAAVEAERREAVEAAQRAEAARLDAERQRASNLRRQEWANDAIDEARAAAETPGACDCSYRDDERERVRQQTPIRTPRPAPSDGASARQ